VLIQVFHGSQVAFFELAATLIPVFLLAGLVTERIRPHEGEADGRNFLNILLIPIFATLGLVAEFLSINAVATGYSVWPFRWFVAGFLIASMVLAILLLWRPWLDRLRQDGFPRERFLRRWSYGIFGILGLLGWVNLATGAGSASKIEAANTYEHRYERNEDARAALRRQIQNLTAEGARVRAQLKGARAEDRPAATVSGLIRERRVLRDLLVEATGEQAELVAKAGHLQKELKG
jgi:hypothetical protein